MAPPPSEELAARAWPFHAASATLTSDEARLCPEWSMRSGSLFAPVTNMRLAKAWIVPLVVAPCLFIGCDRDDTPDVAAAIPEVLASTPPVPVRAEAWTDVRDFYRRRQNVPAWIAEDETTTADRAVHVVRSAHEHGLDPADYGEQDIVRLLQMHASEEGLGQDVLDRARRLAELDVRITTALLALGRDVGLGRTTPETIDRRWKGRRKPPDFVATLVAAMTMDVNTWLDAIRPQHPQYAALQKALVDLRAQQGHVQSGSPEPVIEGHLAQLALNLERWRWMPDDLGPRYLIVNIPSFHLLASENGQSALEMRVVVGKPDLQTPVFSETMTTVVFSPYWNVPDSIVEGETAPAAARDSGFLARNNIEILRLSKAGASPVDPSTVDWDDPAELKKLAFRQRPGAQNALGHVKFLFPNPYDVYLHDTPADQLFARPGRAFSHGCVRVEQPEALAKWVLKDSPEWDDAKIVEAMQAGVEKHVKLKQGIPVHIVYFTVWADNTGAVRFNPDVYGYDAVQLAAQAEL